MHWLRRERSVQFDCYGRRIDEGASYGYRDDCGEMLDEIPCGKQSNCGNKGVYGRPRPRQNILRIENASRQRDVLVSDGHFRRRRTHKVYDQYSSSRSCYCRSYRDVKRCKSSHCQFRGYGDFSTFSVTHGVGSSALSSALSSSENTTALELTERAKVATLNLEECVKDQNAVCQESTNGTTVVGTGGRVSPNEPNVPQHASSALVEDRTIQQDRASISDFHVPQDTGTAMTSTLAHPSELHSTSLVAPSIPLQQPASRPIRIHGANLRPSYMLIILGMLSIGSLIAALW